MENLLIEGTDETPQVTLNKKSEIFEIAGRSLPEDAVEFYRPIVDWIKVYMKDPNPTTPFSFKLDYFNTASSKILLDLLNLLKDIKGIKILWYFNEDDEEILDAGEEFSEQVEAPFEFKTY